MPSRFPVRLMAVAGALTLAGAGAALWLSADDGQAIAAPQLPPANPGEAELEPPIAEMLPAAPQARKKSKEEQRFNRADRDDDGRITQAEFLHQRRRNFDKLDLDGDGKLSFAEYAASGIARFEKADGNRDGHLNAAEFATTAPKPRKPSSDRCKCPTAQDTAATAEAGED